MTNSLVSVVVPIYNVEKYLDRCLNSIVNQTYQDLEIILVDDGSPDHCPKMCEDWACRDKRIKVIHKENAGLGMARNTGIEHASGDYICFFDSDDYVAKDTIEKACALAENEQADIVVFGMSNVDHRGCVICRNDLRTERLSFQGEQVWEQFLPDLIDGRHSDTKNHNLCLSAWSCLFSMKLLRDTNWRFASERECISEDSYSLIWLYRYVSKVAVLPEALYYYCENSASLTRTYRPDRFDRIKQFYRDCHAMAVEQGYGEKIQARIAGLYLSFTIAAMKQVRAADLDIKEKKDRIWQMTEDTLTRHILAMPDCRYRSRARNIMLWAIKNRLHCMVWLLTGLQVKKEEISAGKER